VPRGESRVERDHELAREQVFRQSFCSFRGTPFILQVARAGKNFTFGGVSSGNRFLSGMPAHQRILILDDDQDLLEIYQEILARLPSQPDIRTARSGHEAISMLEMEPFDLMLVDINMPQMDGFQVLAIVRRRFPSLRTVVITAASDEDYRARAYSIGVDLYIEKPKTGREIIFFVDCIESLLERSSQGGFRGVQSKSLLDIIQMECLTQNTTILKLTSARGEGRVWIQKGDVVDATVGNTTGKAAVLEMLKWHSGNFELLPFGLTRPRTIFESYDSLLMETAQQMDESEPSADHQVNGEPLLASLSRYTGVQFAIAVDAADRNNFEHWGADEPTAVATWINGATRTLRTLGETLQAGQLMDIEALGPQRHVCILSGDDEDLGIGFTRALGLAQMRETLKEIEIRWAF
jgi:DNA-binding response OmpR family regulator